jgi:hypothetical protein
MIHGASYCVFKISVKVRYYQIVRYSYIVTSSLEIRYIQLLTCYANHNHHTGDIVGHRGLTVVKVTSSSYSWTSEPNRLHHTLCRQPCGRNVLGLQRGIPMKFLGTVVHRLTELLPNHCQHRRNLYHNYIFK